MNAVARIPDRLTRRGVGPGARARPLSAGLRHDRHHASAPRRWTSFRKPNDKMNVPIASTTAIAAA